jgi:hypothetical protein
MATYSMEFLSGLSSSGHADLLAHLRYRSAKLPLSAARGGRK